MASSINSDNGVVSGSSGLKSSADASGVLELQTNGTAAVSISTAQVVSTTNGMTIQGLTVGRGAGAVSTNTAVGASALAANTSGTLNTALGTNALTANTSGAGGTALGREALKANTTGDWNVGVGVNALIANTTGSNNIAIGQNALQANTTANVNTAVGFQAGYYNTASSNTYLGNQAGYGQSGLSTGDSNVAIGDTALRLITSGVRNVAIGGGIAGNNYGTLSSNTSGSYNTAIGNSALLSNTTASYNTALGYQALYANTTGQINTAVGQQTMMANTTGADNSALGGYALGSNTTGSYNVAIGRQALVSNTTASNNTAVGYQAGYNNTGADNTCIGAFSGYNLSTGIRNTFVGANYSGVGAAGYYVTTGSKNSIFGAYNGNQGSLDIRTASNYIVLSDGDGNPRGFFDNNGKFTIGATNSSADRLLINGPVKFGQAGDTNVYVSFLGGTNYLGGSGTINMSVNSGGVNLTNGATSWASASDERLKDIIEPITDAVAKVGTLRTVMGKYKTDAEGTRRPFLIAQDVIAVLPEAVDSIADSRTGDETEYLSVRYTDTIPLLVAAIKELKAEFDAYKASHP